MDDARCVVKVSSDTREWIRQQAQDACEYCQLPQRASVLPHQVDHIIGRQHGGSDDVEKLCLCCVRCNLKKGPNIASIDPETRAIVALVHPRRQSWREHFSVRSDRTVHGLTAEGRATVQLLDMNDAMRVRLRTALSRGSS
jgi:hypothetical protein